MGQSVAKIQDLGGQNATKERPSSKFKEFAAYALRSFRNVQVLIGMGVSGVDLADALRK